MQSAFTNICEKMGCSEELSILKRGTVMGCHVCNKPAIFYGKLWYYWKVEAFRNSSNSAMKWKPR